MITALSVASTADAGWGQSAPAANFSLAAAAAAGAGAAASGVIANRVAQAAASVGSAAASLEASTSGSAHPTWTWQGWVSGAAGDEAADGRFARFRGKPLGIVAVWCDSTVEAQTNLEAIHDYDDFKGQMDIAVGAFGRGETWQQAASGQFVARWTASIRRLRAARAGKGTTYIRFAHEMNGDWMPWGVNASKLAAFKKAYRLYAGLVRKEFPQARLTFSPNGANHTNVSIEQLWPGDDVVDVIGPDIYDGYPDVTSAQIWQDELFYYLSPGNPQGMGAWQQFASAHGKPLGMPEWGLPRGDHPQFIKGVHDFMAQYAATPGSSDVAGKFVYDVYFNAEPKFKLANGSNTKAAAMYASLTWGN